VIGINIFPNGATGNCPGKPVPGSPLRESESGSFAPYGAVREIDGGDDKNWTASFTFQRPAGDQLILDGRMDNHQVHMELQLTDRNSFLLVSRGFHWIQEAPFGRW